MCVWLLTKMRDKPKAIGIPKLGGLSHVVERNLNLSWTRLPPPRTTHVDSSKVLICCLLIIIFV